MHSNRVLVLGLLLGAPAALAPTAAAHEGEAGGATAPTRPTIAELRCDAAASPQQSCARGSLLALRGEQLNTVHAAVFLGQRGTADDRRSSIRRRSPHRALVRVPRTAQTGPVRVLSAEAGRSRPSAPLEVLDGSPPSAAPPAGGGVFPVQGRVDFGTATNRLGGGRGHQGQDIFARCGTPIVAAVGGTLNDAGTDGVQGNYAVVRAEDGTEQAYLHMLSPAEAASGDAVTAGQRLGAVGETGNAQGCHLHFELWTAPGRFAGGQVIDPLPSLRRWQGAS